ncbi:peptidylprolyl isomerase [Pelagovum pacificum]|uniref:Parvulin-like PPIase n=1 Tax=Pelagovum pacificum TaxID=2588711 RepID=A0A5C5GBW2_9RHOB|nr:peptidylprolyl isomerase [Pelagovum pacificum]QQA44616.1 SurA N-terminal domain-containing protein [Pelagovum pacificum]TNY32272.1 peptidylprolyl isomerase [Pelagovum pacificum]
MAKKTAKSVATWVILALLFFGLIGFGATNLSGTSRSLGSAGEKDIPIQDYARELNRQINQLQQQTGTSLGFAEVEAFGLDRMVLSSLVQRRTLENEAAQLGISVGDDRVAAAIRSAAPFRGLDGSFDREAYRMTLNSNGLSETEYENGLRDTLSRELLQRAVSTGIPAPEPYADTVAAYLGETRSFEWIEVTADDLEEPVAEPSDEQLQTFYDENIDQFTRPETKSITYVSLTPAMIADELDLDEEALRDMYEQRMSDYVRPERRLVERLVFRDDEAAQAAFDRLERDEVDFDGLVTERGLSLADIDLGDMGEDELGAAGEGVFAADTGEVVGPFETDLGPALFRVNAVLAAQETPFEEAREELSEELGSVRARQVIEGSAEGITDLIAGGASMEDLAERTDLELGTIDYSEGTEDGIAAYAEFRNAADEAAPEDFPELLELSDGGVFALRVDEVRAPEPIPFEEAREDVAAAWTATETAARVITYAEELADRVAEEGFTDDMPAPAAETGLDRRGVVGGTPPGFLGEVFDMAEGETQALPNGEGAVVVRLSAVTPADPEDDTLDNEVQQFAEQAQQGIQQEVMETFARSVQTRTDVRIDEAAVNSVNASFR